jgi:hypothetical protein
MLDFITSSLHPACNGCNYMRLHDHYMQNKMLMNVILFIMAAPKVGK